MFLTTGMTTFDSAVQLIGLIILFVIIIFATHYTTRYVGKFQNNQMKKSNFKVIESYRISQGKYLQIIKVSSKYFVIALGKDEITFISQLEEDEILLKDDMVFKDTKFSEYLSDFVKRKKHTNHTTDNKG